MAIKRHPIVDKVKGRGKNPKLYAKYKKSYDKRTKLMDLLRPYGISRYQVQGFHNPAKGTMIMNFGADSRDEDHIVPFYVGYDKTKVFEYRGGSMMPVG
jgi:hypothetical protein